MADQTPNNVEEEDGLSFLSMSDEEMLNATPPSPERAEPVAETVAETQEEGTGAADDETDGGTKDAGTASDGTPAGTEEAKAPAKADPAKEAPAETGAPKTEAPAIDYEAEYKRLLTPFKANGRDMQVNSVDDAVALMQMGANYNKKMAALKPNLKLMKMLENNDLLSEEKISFLIDLGKKDPAAINKLVKDSGLDPMDLDPDKAGAYKQTSYVVDDRAMELDTVLDELQDTPTYNRTLDVVGNKWDAASKQVVSQAPQLLKVLNDHMASGIYDLISKEIERERVFGRLSGVSDIDAYRQIGDAINARGGFNHLTNSSGQGTGTTRAAEVVQPKPQAGESEMLKDKRRAASPTKAAAPASEKPNFNPLALSDEEFSKQAAPQYR